MRLITPEADRPAALVLTTWVCLLRVVTLPSQTLFTPHSQRCRQVQSGHQKGGWVHTVPPCRPLPSSPYSLPHIPTEAGSLNVLSFRHAMRHGSLMRSPCGRDGRVFLKHVAVNSHARTRRGVFVYLRVSTSVHEDVRAS